MAAAATSQSGPEKRVAGTATGSTSTSTLTNSAQAAGIPATAVDNRLAAASSRRPSTDEEKASEAPSHDHGPDLLVEEKQAVENLGTADPANDFPDGGLRAWLVVASGVCCTASAFGYVNSWGAFQAYYESHMLSNRSPSDIAWIGSLQYSLTFLPCLVTGRLFDIGYLKIPLFAASCLMVAAAFLTAECTEYWHFLLCQGFGVGLASGFIFGPVVSVIAHWWKKRRGLALGITAVGSSIGGTIFPIAFRKLIEPVGFHWTMRILGFMLLLLLALPNICMQRRLPPVVAPGGLVNFHPFKQPALFLYTLGGFVCFLGIYTVLTYIDVSATFKGVSPDFAFYLVSIANASSALGRIMCGVFADRFGPLTVMIPMTAVAGVLTYAWPFVHTQGQFVAISILYGIGSGAFVSLLPVPAMAMGNMEDVGRRSGMFMTILALGALAGPPISGAVNRATHGFVSVGAYAGSCVFAAVFLMAAARYIRLGGWKGKF